MVELEKYLKQNMLSARQLNHRPDPLDDQDQQILLLELCKIGTVNLLDSGYYSYEDFITVFTALNRIVNKSLKRSEIEY